MTVRNQDDCTTLRKNLPALARQGKTAVSCVQRRATASKTAKETLHAPSIAAVVDLPQWCIDNAFTGWWMTRTNACLIEDWVLNVINTQTGAVVGTMNYLMLTLTYTSTSIQTWAQQVELRPYTQTGAAVGTSVQGNASCTGACVVSGVTFPPQPMVLNRDAEAEAYFETTATAAGAVGQATNQINLTFTNPAWAAPTSGWVNAPRVRCDNATAGNTNVGCVFPDYAPVLIVSLSGPYPNFARHIRDAQASGLRGAYPNGTPLTRMVNAANSDRNGATACPDASAGGYPRPTGYSCDEYPFRSTYEGAFTAASPPPPGRTFNWCQIPALPQGATGPMGWSACMIPIGENSGGGALLNGFGGLYRTERVLDRDQFYVWVVP